MALRVGILEWDLSVGDKLAELLQRALVVLEGIFQERHLATIDLALRKLSGMLTDWRRLWVVVGGPESMVVRNSSVSSRVNPERNAPKGRYKM